MSVYAWSQRPTTPDELAARRRQAKPLLWPWAMAPVALGLAALTWMGVLTHRPGLGWVSFLALIVLAGPTLRRVRALRRQEVQRAWAFADYAPVAWDAPTLAVWAESHAPGAQALLEAARLSPVGLLRGDLMHAQLGHSIVDLSERQRRLDEQQAAVSPA